MKVDFSIVLHDLDGKNLFDIDKPDKPITLGMVCINALMATYKDEDNLSGEEKLKRFDLASAIHAANGEIDLSVEQIAKIKQLIAKGYTVLIVGQTWKMLEGQYSDGEK